MTNEATCSEDCTNEDRSVAKFLDEDRLTVDRLKRLGFFCVIKNGSPIWGNA